MKVNKTNVGDKIWLKPDGNQARRSKEIREYEIKKVGRKYYEVWDGEFDGSTIKFTIEGNSQVTEYTADWEVYFSKQEILDEEEYKTLHNNIKRKVDIYGRPTLTLDQLRRINTIIIE